MVEGGGELERALRGTRADARAQSLRASWIGYAAASYALDTLFLALFWLAGMIPGHVALVYGSGGAALSAAFYALTVSRWSLRLAEPGMVAPQTLAGVAMQLAVVAMAPPIAFPYLVNVLTVLAFGMVWLPVRAALGVWIATAAASGVLLHSIAPVAVRAATPAALLWSWLYFSLVLGRCVLLSVYASGLRARLHDSREKLAGSLERIQSLVSFDELTGTLNRRSLSARLEEERARCERGGERFGVALFDLDHFKAVNDTYGHAKGDQVLKEFADAVRGAMRDSDVFGRHGGEEFMLLLPRTGAEAALRAVERVRASVQARNWSRIAPEFVLTVSGGVTVFRSGETAEQVLARADGALYEAKRGGRNRVCVA